MREAEIRRKTKETDIVCKLNIDGKGNSEISTGVGFFDHMLTAFARHGFFDIYLKCEGDTYVDGHHTVEDCGIVLGQAFYEALGTKDGIKRYGCFTLPMDETLVTCAVDLCGRPYLNFDVNISVPRLGHYDTEVTKEFFYAFSYSAMMNLHLKELAGENNHHKIEACFKAFAKAMDEATKYDERVEGSLSTKGVI